MDEFHTTRSYGEHVGWSLSDSWPVAPRNRLFIDDRRKFVSVTLPSRINPRPGNRKKPTFTRPTRFKEMLQRGSMRFSELRLPMQ